MSIKVMSWVFEHGPSDPSERLVLLALADYASDNGEWSPSMVGIAQKAGMTERGARGVIRRLEAGGWIAVKVGGGRGGRSQYRVLMGQGNPERETGNDKPGTINREYSDKPGTKRPETRNQRSAEPSETIKVSKNPPTPRRGEDNEAVTVLTEIVGSDVAEAFVAHRKAKRARLTAHAARLIVRKLDGHPNPAAELERSIMQGWTGVFPEQARAGPSDPPPTRIRARLPSEIQNEDHP